MLEMVCKVKLALFSAMLHSNYRFRFACLIVVQLALSKFLYHWGICCGHSQICTLQGRMVLCLKMQVWLVGTSSQCTPIIPFVACVICCIMVRRRCR